MDGVCSVGSEDIRFDDWGLDIVLTASQKGLGTPPGLSIVVASPRAIKVGVQLCHQNHALNTGYTLGV